MWLYVVAFYGPILLLPAIALVAALTAIVPEVLPRARARYRGRT